MNPDLVPTVRGARPVYCQPAYVYLPRTRPTPASSNLCTWFCVLTAAGIVLAALVSSVLP